MVIRQGDRVNIREPCRKGQSISAPPTGVVLTGAAQTHLIMLSVSPRRARGREDGSLGKDAICGEIAPMRRCALTPFSPPALCVQTAARRANGINGTTPRQRRSATNVITPLDFTAVSAPRRRGRTEKAARVLSERLFAYRLVEGAALRGALHLSVVTN